jgi:PBP1b-binding outer membrane lipoprotein LpoB
MKNKIIIITLACSACFLAACSGDRTPHSGTDTVKNTYGVAKDTDVFDTSRHANVDSSKQAKPKK